MSSVGIDNLGFYVSKPRISVASIVAEYAKIPELFERMQQAVGSTGQEFMRLTKVWEDSVCLASNAVLDILRRIVSLDTLRYFISATETPVDAAKPIVAYVLGILTKAGISVPKNVVTYQTQHACASSTASVLQAAAMIQTTPRESSAIITSVDIARYSPKTTAEITQGAGAVAMHITRNPRLLEIDIQSAGFYSKDTDDFFRPLDSVVAKVRGGYSMVCYIESVTGALIDHAHNTNQDIKDLLYNTDYFIFHIPFGRMPVLALERVLKKQLHLSDEAIRTFIAEKLIVQSTEASLKIGNTYTASVYFTLGSLLSHQNKSIGKDIVGKKLLILSYGSGNTSIVLSGIVAKQAPQVISEWSLDHQINTYDDITHQDYLQWVNTPTPIPPTESEIASMDPGMVYLEQIRADGYRVYNVT